MVVPTKTERRFVLTLHPNSEGNDWGMTLVETSGGHSQVIADLAVPRASIYRRHVCDAVTDAGYQRTAVSPRRKKPFNLTQEPGVRLALTVMALNPVSKPLRRQAIADGIAAMTSEETLYWYAQSVGSTGSRALKALRVLLAEE